MKRVFILMIALLVASASGWAEELKLGYVDIEKALNDSDAGKKAMNELEAQKKKTQTKINERIAAKEKLQAELEKQEAVLSADAKRGKMDEIEKLENEIERMISDANAELQKKLRNLNMSILTELNDVMDKIGKEEGFAIIFPADVIIYSSKAVDLTDAVIRKYNESKAEAEKKTESTKDVEKKEEKKQKK